MPPIYSTDLLLKNKIIRYSVHKEGDRLFFKPEMAFNEVDAPIFWVVKTGGLWKPVNITDESFIRQVQDNISKHYAENENLN
jgi:hypothetical protein